MSTCAKKYYYSWIAHIHTFNCTIIMLILAYSLPSEFLPSRNNEGTHKALLFIINVDVIVVSPPPVRNYLNVLLTILFSLIRT